MKTKKANARLHEKRIERLRVKPAYKKLEPFFDEIEKQYGVSRDEILRVVDDVGFIKGQIKTFFMVRAHERGRG